MLPDSAVAPVTSRPSFSVTNVSPSLTENQTSSPPASPTVISNVNN